MILSDKYIRDKLMASALSPHIVKWTIETLPHDGIYGMVRERIVIERLLPEDDKLPQVERPKEEKPKVSEPTNSHIQ